MKKIIKLGIVSLFLMANLGLSTSHLTGDQESGKGTIGFVCQNSKGEVFFWFTDKPKSKGFRDCFKERYTDKAKSSENDNKKLSQIDEFIEKLTAGDDSLDE